MKPEKSTKLGHYEILSLIRADGICEVYLAEYMKLDRNITQKILRFISCCLVVR
jgi:hypothetical protein